MSKTIQQWQDENGAWGDETFPESDDFTVFAHLSKEIHELDHAQWDDEKREEMADVVILIMQWFHKRGERLEDAIAAKMKVNREREWKSQPEPEGHWEHVR